MSQESIEVVRLAYHGHEELVRFATDSGSEALAAAGLKD